MTDCAWGEVYPTERLKYGDYITTEDMLDLKNPGVEDLKQVIHQNAIEHGWWDEERTIPEIIALCHSELSEALEAYRNNEPLIWINDGKPDGIAVEMCDCIIRILDWLGKENLPVGQIIVTKHMYNTTRPYKHGGKVI